MVALGIFGVNVVLGLAVVLVGRLVSPLPVPLATPNESWILPVVMTLGSVALFGWFAASCGAPNVTVMGRCQRPSKGLFRRCYSHDDPITLHDALGVVWTIVAIALGFHFLGPLAESFKQGLG